MIIYPDVSPISGCWHYVLAHNLSDEDTMSNPMEYGWIQVRTQNRIVSMFESEFASKIPCYFDPSLVGVGIGMNWKCLKAIKLKQIFCHFALFLDGQVGFHCQPLTHHNCIAPGSKSFKHCPDQEKTSQQAVLLWQKSREYEAYSYMIHHSCRQSPGDLQIFRIIYLLGFAWTTQPQLIFQVVCVLPSNFECVCLISDLPPNCRQDSTAWPIWERNSKSPIASLPFGATPSS